MCNTLFTHYIAPDDYEELPTTIITLDSVNASEHGYINIIDDMLEETVETFTILLRSLNEECAIVTPNSTIPVFIIDNDGMFTYD